MKIVRLVVTFVMLVLVFQACATGPIVRKGPAGELPDDCKPFAPPVDSETTPPKPLHRENPRAPRLGYDRGFACALATVTATGAVEDVVIVATSNQEFAKAFSAALVRWTFEPATKNGTPVSFRGMYSSAYERWRP